MSHGLFEEDTLMTANCIPINKVDNMATNGIVHVLDGVLTPVTQPISQIIAENGKFTILSGSKYFKFKNEKKSSYLIHILWGFRIYFSGFRFFSKSNIKTIGHFLVIFGRGLGEGPGYSRSITFESHILEI